MNIGVQIVDEAEGRIVGVTVDGIVRTFSIRMSIFFWGNYVQVELTVTKKHAEKC